MPPANSEKKEPKPYNPLKTPKQRFQEYSQWIGEHRQMVDSIAFQRGLDYAMLQYQQQIAGSVTDSAGAGAAGLRPLDGHQSQPITGGRFVLAAGLNRSESGIHHVVDDFHVKGELRVLNQTTLSQEGSGDGDYIVGLSVRRINDDQLGNVDIL